MLSIFSCTQEKLDQVQEQTIGKKAIRPYNALTTMQVVKMLEHYDITRKPILENALGFEDTRINYYSIETLENYLAYVKQLSKEKGISVTGLSFVSAAYPKNFDHGTENHQTFIFMPMVEIDGKNIPFDAEASTNGKIVTMKESLASYGYNWVYDSKEDYENRNNISKEIRKKSLYRGYIPDTKSSSGNVAYIKPPY